MLNMTDERREKLHRIRSELAAYYGREMAEDKLDGSVIDLLVFECLDLIETGISPGKIVRRWREKEIRRMSEGQTGGKDVLSP